MSLFNKSKNGSAEMRKLTGNFYANANFDKVSNDIELATDELAKIVGAAVIAKAQEDYTAGTENALIDLVRIPIAYLAALNMYRKNDLSHEDSGRKVKISETSEKLPWEWQVEKDNQLHLELYYKTTDRLINYLESNSVSEWLESNQRKRIQQQFIRTADQFNEYFPIDGSARTFVMLAPFIREAERLYIKPALGADYTTLLTVTTPTDAQNELLELVYPPIPLLAMCLAFRRMAISILPIGVVRQAISSTLTMNAAELPSIDDIKRVADWFEDDAIAMIEKLKRKRLGDREVNLLPKNDPNNKYFRA
jgi:hypothetical protein